MTLGDETTRAMIAAVDGPKVAAPKERALTRDPFPVTAEHEARGGREGVCPLVFAIREHTGIDDWVLYDPEAPGDLWSLNSETRDEDIWIDGGVRHAVDQWNGGGGWHTGERLDPRFVLADIGGAAFVEYVDEYQTLDVLQSSEDGREWCDEACSTGADFDREYRDLRDDGRHVRIVQRRVRVLDEKVTDRAAPTGRPAGGVS